MVKKFRRYLYSFWRNSRTWQTDGRTVRHRMPAIAGMRCLPVRHNSIIASHGKKRSQTWRGVVRRVNVLRSVIEKFGTDHSLFPVLSSANVQSVPLMWIWNYQVVSLSASWLSWRPLRCPSPLAVTPGITSEITWPSTWWRNKSVGARSTIFNRKSTDGSSRMRRGPIRARQCDICKHNERWWRSFALLPLRHIFVLVFRSRFGRIHRLSGEGGHITASHCETRSITLRGRSTSSAWA